MKKINIDKIEEYLDIKIRDEDRDNFERIRDELSVVEPLGFITGIVLFYCLQHCP